MPLSAIINGETIIGPDLSEKEWADLAAQHKKGLAITMACCGAPGHLRRSKRGTQHFYHAVDTGCGYAEESLEHLELKYLIYRTCKDAGWETHVEFPAPDRSWVADVLAEKDGRKVAFEIQISALSPDQLAERDRNYRDAGIESYWLLDEYLGRAHDFASSYESWLREGDPRPGERVPYLDESVFETGTENHVFITRRIRTAGLHAKKQEVFTTNNPAIPAEVFAREVLAGNYRKYLEETAAAFEHTRKLRARAAPALFRFREFYHAIVRDRTYRKRADRALRILKNGKLPANDLRKKSGEICSELEWLETEYRLYISDPYGLFAWKRIPGKERPVLVFRPGPASQVKKLDECVKRFDRWESSFSHAMDVLERRIADGKSR
ncbi:MULTISPECIES: competence protein CoiA [unclassified Methanoregula]|uniref:competence protein CoiA n=1 Tax=unclassified Methanoregula TaxID=2649730 RepID=UPI0009CDAC7F|nr:MULTISPECIES: competence protein CoiA family protein [unclassified Methanoregula]OPX63798.1 MAG: Competence protein CoiA-like family protein [Methanoregula sp. PtaB.Bin085]OPY36661.1 MAG: Competence protein CoiA-like family protein [Methanoregula sp. PtaU1.Bin006]